MFNAAPRSSSRSAAAEGMSRECCVRCAAVEIGCLQSSQPIKTELAMANTDDVVLSAELQEFLTRNVAAFNTLKKNRTSLYV